MTFDEAVKTAYTWAKFHQSKRYVWAFVSERGGIVWTVTDKAPDASFKDSFEWKDGQWHRKARV